jgi:hypothetical protein
MPPIRAAFLFQHGMSDTNWCQIGKICRPHPARLPDIRHLKKVVFGVFGVPKKALALLQRGLFLEGRLSQSTL